LRNTRFQLRQSFHVFLYNREERVVHCIGDRWAKLVHPWAIPKLLSHAVVFLCPHICTSPRH
jgi:hypothetical protein